MQEREYAKMARLQGRHWWFEAKRMVVAAVVRRHADVPDGSRVLEVGCGTGAMLPLLQEFGSVVGIDVHRAALGAARDAAGVPATAALVAGDAMRLPCRAGRFDLAGCFDLLYHRGVSDPESALLEVARVVRAGGWVVVTDSACPALYGAHDRAHHGARRFSRDEMLRVLAAAKLEVVHISYFHKVVFPLVAASRLGGRWWARLRTAEPAAEGASQLSRVPAPLNALLRSIYLVEAPLAARTGLPVGVSLVALARRP